MPFRPRDSFDISGRNLGSPYPPSLFESSTSSTLQLAPSSAPWSEGKPGFGLTLQIGWSQPGIPSDT